MMSPPLWFFARAPFLGAFGGPCTLFRFSPPSVIFGPPFPLWGGPFPPGGVFRVSILWEVSFRAPGGFFYPSMGPAPSFVPNFPKTGVFRAPFGWSAGFPGFPVGLLGGSRPVSGAQLGWSGTGCVSGDQLV